MIEILRRRFTPCVCCFIEDELMEKHPECKEELTRIWRTTQLSSSPFFRLIFMDERPSIEVIWDWLYNSNAGTPKDFSKLLEILLEFSYLMPYLTLDIPIAIIMVCCSQECLKISPVIPAWAVNRFNDQKASLLRYPHPNLSDALSNWVKSSLYDRFNEYTRQVEDSYNTLCVGFKWAFFDSVFKTSSMDSLLSLKSLADLRLMQERFDEALYLYQRLISYGQTPFSSQAYFLASITQIYLGYPEKESLRLLDQSSSFVQDINHRAICSILGVILASNIYEDYAPFLAKTLEFQNDPLTIILQPFILEQIALISGDRKAAFLFYKAAETIPYHSNKQRCLLKAWSFIKESSFPLIKQTVLDSLMSLQLTEDFYRTEAMFILKDRQVFRSDLLKLVDKSECRSITASFSDAVCKHYPFSPPKSLRAMWKSLAEKMFGAYHKGEFFNGSLLNEKMCSVGDEVTIVCGVKSKLSCPIKEYTLITNNCASISRCVLIDPLVFTITTRESGDMEVLGIECVLDNGVTLQSKFIDPIQIKIHEESPKLQIFSTCSSNVYAGAFVLFTVTVKATVRKIEYLSLIVMDPDTTFLLDPDVQVNFGQYQFGSLDKEESIELNFVSYFNTQGDYSVHLLFSFWGHQSPPKYVHKEFTFSAALIPLNWRCNEESVQIELPPKSSFMGLYTEHPIIKHEPIRTSVISLGLIGKKSKSAPMDLPLFVSRFNLKRPSVFFRYKGFLCSIPIELPKLPFLLTFESNPNSIECRFENIGDHVLTEVKISLVVPHGFLSYFVRGKELIVLGNILPGNSKHFTFETIPFDSRPCYQMLVACDQFTILRDLPEIVYRICEE